MSRPRAIVLTGRMPWPMDDGGRVALAQSVASLADAWEVTLLTMVPRGGAPAAADSVPPGLVARGVRVVAIERSAPPAALAVLEGLAGPLPYTLARYRSAPYAAALRREVARTGAELVCANNLHLGQYEADARPAAFVLREQNVEHIWLQRYSESLAFWPARWYAGHQAWRMRHAERALCERADLVLAIQPHEGDALRRLAPRAWVELVPAAVDFDRFLPRAPAPVPTVLLCGMFSWPPNVEGARQFLERGWPRVLARVPGARLRIVGKDIPEKLAALARASGAEPVGYVESFPPELAAATAMVVPLWVGAGARIKIVEALAAGTPVVTTSLGCEGLGIEPGRHALVDDDPAGLGDALASLLTDPARAARIAAAGRELALAHFSLEAVGRRTVELCREAVRRRACGPPGSGRT